MFVTLSQNSNNNNIGNNDVTDSQIRQSSSNEIRIIAISDTHNGYNKLTQQLIDLYQSENDILVHCGDMTERGSVDELNNINSWFGELPYKYKIAISGNMDGIGLDKQHIDGYKIFTNAVYLQHQSLEIPDLGSNGFKIFASPYTPEFVGGFQLYSEKESRLKWQDIPNDIDLLISHGPPYNILDSTSRGMSIGDKVLMNEINQRIKPKAVLFGHVHASFGQTEVDGIQYVNAAQFNGIYSGDSSVKPVVITIKV